MKRNKESGASFRRQRRLREQTAAKLRGSLLKYLEVAADTGDSQGDGPNGSESSVPSTPLNTLDTEPEELLPASTLQTAATGAELYPPASSVQNEPDVNTSRKLPSESGEEHSELIQLTSIIPNDEFCENNTASNDLRDVGNWPADISDSMRVFLVKQGASVAQHMEHDFPGVPRPGDSTKGTVRTLTREWFYRKLLNGEKILRSWMTYSPVKQSIFCFCCKLFRNSARPNSALSSMDGFCQWWKLNPKIGEHESSASHTECFLEWKSLEMRLVREKTIDDVAQQAIGSEVKKWRALLLRFFDIIKFLAKQNLAFRGHRESIEEQNDGGQGNFLELVNLLASYDPVLREHLTQIRLGQKKEISYMSPTIQNEMINVLGTQVRKEIIQRVKKAKYFCVILDSTPDVSHKDQMSQILRYVRIDGTHVRVVESFVDFLEIEGKKAEDLMALILKKLDEDGLDFQDCRGQAYDNASTMAGRLGGLQARMKAINPEAVFVACTNHSLNLAGMYAASEAVGSLTFFGTLNQAFSFFSSSTHRWSILVEASGRGMKRIVETRWSARFEAVNMFRTHYSQILEALCRLTQAEENCTTRTDAALLVNALRSFSFFCYLVFWAAILREIEDAQRYLQTSGLDIHKCAIKILALKNNLIESRDNVVNEAVVRAKGICDELGIDTPITRMRRRKRQFGETSEEATLSLEEELRRELYACFDRILQEISSRFEQLKQLNDRFGFLAPSRLMDEAVFLDLEYAPRDIVKDDFLLERSRLCQFLKACTPEEIAETMDGGPLELLRFIRKFRLEASVPNIDLGLRIFLTVGVSAASCERSFSKLKLIKSYLRSTMAQLRLSNLALLSIENEITNELDFEQAISDFAELKARKVHF